MKTLFRFFALALATALLVALTNCTQSPETSSNNASPTSTTETAAVTDNTDKVNINTAILSELDRFEAQLGVPALSDKIQAARPYGSAEDLVAKQVITQEQFDKIKGQVTVEDIVLTGVAKDIDYMTKLGLMKGHLLVAQELLAQGKPEQAEPHIGHPVEEIYVDVEEQFQERNVPEFKTTLIDLQNLMKSQPNSDKIETQFEQSMQAVDNAIAILPESQRQSPDFVLHVMNGLLEAANAEYGAAIANNKIAALIEYQDSRGFVNYTDTLHHSISEPLAKENAAAKNAIASSFSELKTAWPSVEAPATPVKSPEEVTQLVKTIEQNSQKVMS